MVFATVGIAVDFTEKLDDFIKHGAPWQTVLFTYYPRFILQVGALFSPVCILLSVIYFTSRMNANSEIVAVLGNGISYYRLLRAYLIGALIIGLIMLGANHYLIPEANKGRLEFENRYAHSPIVNKLEIFLTLEKSKDLETNVFMQRFQYLTNEGSIFSLEKISK